MKSQKTAASTKLRAFVLKRLKEKQTESKRHELTDAEKLIFRCSKSPIEFIDYDQGKSYSVLFDLVNCSTRLTSFRFLALSPGMDEIFSVSHEPIGRMAPGMSCTCTLNFFPVLKSDLDFSIRAVSDEGAFSIPVRCRYKRTNAELGASVVTLPPTIISETTESFFALVNKGGLGSSYEIFSSSGEKLFPCAARNSEASKSVLRVECSGFLAGYSCEQIRVFFSPVQPGKFREQLSFHFENILDQPVIIGELKGEAFNLPVEVSRTHFDFGIVLVGGKYKGSLSLFNTSSHTAKMEVAIDDTLKPFFLFSPQSSYVQAKSSLTIWVKLSVTDGLRKTLESTQGKENVSSVKFQIRLSLHTHPFEISVSFVISPDQLAFPRFLSFETLYEQNSKALKAEFSNQALVVQTLCFLDLPSTISLRPQVNPLKLPPSTSCEIHFIYQAHQSGVDEGFFRLRVLTASEKASEFYINYKANVLAVPLHFSVKRVIFPAISVNENHQVTVSVNNVSNRKFQLELGSHDLQATGLSVEPQVMALEPGGSSHLRIEYRPGCQELNPQMLMQKDYCSNEEFLRFKAEKEELTTNLKSTETDASLRLTKVEQEAKEKKVATLRSHLEILEAQITNHRQSFEQNFKVDEFFKSRGGFVFTLDNITIGRWLLPVYFHTSGEFAAQRVWMEVYTALKPQVTLTSNLHINFGRVPICSEKVTSISLSNPRSIPVKAICESRDFAGVFSCRSSPATIPPDGTRQLSMAFIPPTEGKFKNVLRISGDYPFELTVVGEGVAAAYKFSYSYDLFNCGTARLGGRTQNTLRFENLLDIPISFQFQHEESLGQAAVSFPTISFFPQRKTLEKGESCTITVSFEPSALDSVYFEVFKLVVDGETKNRKIGFVGSCFSESGYALPYIDFEKMGIAEALTSLKATEGPEQFLYACSQGGFFEKLISPPKANDLNIGPENAKVTLGSLVQQGGTTLDFEVTCSDIREAGSVQIEPARGKLNPGQTCVVAFSPAAHLRACGGIPLIKAVELEVSFVIQGKSERVARKRVFYHFQTSF